MVWIMEVGVNGKYRSNIDLETGFFFNFAYRCCANILSPFNVSARNTPHFRIRTHSFHQEYTVTIVDNYGHPNRRIAVMQFIAVPAEAP